MAILYQDRRDYNEAYDWYVKCANIREKVGTIQRYHSVHFQRGLNLFSVEIALLVDYNKVFKNTHFDAKFQVSSMFGSGVVVIGNFRYFAENFGFLNNFDHF